MSVVEKRKLVTNKHPHLSVVKQCELLGIHRSGFYFKPRGESGLNLRLMECIDKKFMECPFYGVARMTSYLRYELGYAVNEKRIRPEGIPLGKALSADGTPNSVSQT